MRTMTTATVTLLAMLGLSACSNPVDEFTQACNDSTNMGEEICKCTAEKAKAELSEPGFAFLLATISGDAEKAVELSGELQLSETVAASLFMVSAPAKCALDGME